MRIEEDAFGKITIPEDALYGIQTARTVRNLSFSGRTLSGYPAYIVALSEVKKAAAIANYQAGLIEGDIRDAIIDACDLIAQGKHHDQFPVDVFHGGGSIGTNMNINEVIARLAGVQPTDHVNACQSTSDVCHTAIRLTLIKMSEPLCHVILSFIQTLDKKAKEFESIDTIARTCLQDGMKVSLSAIFSGFSSALKRRLASLGSAIDRLHLINLGGTVVGSGVGATDGYRSQILPVLCEVTGLPLRFRENLYDAAQHPDDLVMLSGELRLLAGLFIKFAKDLRLLSSGPETGFAEIQLPAVQAGSSFFPGKVNPVIPETVIQCGFLVTGNDQAIQMALDHGELHLNIWEGLMGILLMDNLSMLAAVIRLFDESCIRGIRANREKCHKYATSFIPLIVELKEKYGYSQVSTWMKECCREELKEKFERR